VEVDVYKENYNLVLVLPDFGYI